jgi:hypothetical protein
MKPLLALLAVVPVVVAFGSGARVLSRADVSHALLAQMNGSSSGHITNRVGCSHGTTQKPSGAVRYTCVLIGIRATQRAFVTVNGTSWRAEFAPLQG